MLSVGSHTCDTCTSPGYPLDNWDYSRYLMVIAISQNDICWTSMG